ncbi:hypothetical protein QWY85_13515 [Neolewinella lacunae]|uniref:Uncharacterized protein n=1 Tax=Neolewinella lacunae TaxID=1517758 RepID=A0A923PFT1_9BACT|nr:hypothetical protein [Neolewinella lacunae]MBC6993272.1 hypothetical protein [Neolewinella lacunae]MDN3635681.1 hypothetical protein [Neolewinella lacunae]
MRFSHCFLALLLIPFLCTCGARPNEDTVVSTADSTGMTPAGGNAVDTDQEGSYAIANGAFLGIKPGEPLANYTATLRAGLLQTGEGDFDVFYIDGAAGEELGYVMPDPNDESKVGDIYLTSPKVRTSAGVHVGMTHARLVEVLGPLEFHGSEIEGYTSAQKDGMAYRIDAGNWSYEIDQQTITPETELIEIVILR